MNILSVDWDYFFPCIDEYDWGHGEHFGGFFELIWNTRVFNRKDRDYGNLSAPTAFDEVKVNQKELNAFMETVLQPYPGLLKIYVSDSHAAIWDMMTWIKRQLKTVDFNVYNLDAHHDYHYGQKPNACEIPDCATWAYQGKQAGLINKYRLIYPEWRKESPEPGGFERVVNYADGVSYGFQNAALPKRIDLLFVCRSSAWTPTWEDEHWMTLLQRLEAVYPKCWKQKAYNELALKKREFNYGAAKAYHDQTLKLMAERGVL